MAQTLAKQRQTTHFYAYMLTRIRKEFYNVNMCDPEWSLVDVCGWMRQAMETEDRSKIRRCAIHYMSGHPKSFWTILYKDRQGLFSKLACRHDMF